jgi:hypothetical protein
MRCHNSSTITSPYQRWNTEEIINKLDKVPFGETLASEVACNIDKGLCMTYIHRDFCGQGIFSSNWNISWDTAKYPPHGYRICDVVDGYPQGFTYKEFALKEEFVKWLAVHSDFSMSGIIDNEFYTADPWRRNNQRITKDRLLMFVATVNNGN